MSAHSQAKSSSGLSSHTLEYVAYAAVKFISTEAYVTEHSELGQHNILYMPSIA